jgi:HSP20 family molecular chaperone IbpA
MVEKKAPGKKPTKKPDEYAEKIKTLEKRIEELEEEKREEPSIVGGVVGELIPGLGNIVKVLEKTSPEFRKKIADTDVEIKHRIETGWGTKPIGDFGISFRPIKSEKGPRTIRVRRAAEEGIKIPEKEPVIDVFEEKDHISVIAELPGVNERDIKTKIEGNELDISARRHSRKVTLPATPGAIIERTYKNGILHLTIEKKEKKGNVG